MTLLAAWDWHRFTKFDVWGVLFWVNVIVLLALVIIAVMALVRDRNERAAANLVPFYEDDDLETRRLERVLGWALLFSAVLAISYGVYWLREPSRQEASEDYFFEGAAERGEVLFSNKSMETYDSAQSLACADCHGAPAEDPDLGGKVVVGGGGAAPNVFANPGDEKSYAAPWKAPAVNTVLYRFSVDEVRDILVYGRPGSPMAAWGTDGDGPLNDQSINDLIAYLASIQISPEDAQKKSTAELERARAAADAQVETAQGALTDAEATLQTATDALAAITDTESNEYGKAKRALDAAKVGVREANDELDWATEWAERRAGVTDGQLLFELNCARCHTKNWSIFNPANEDLAPEAYVGPAGAGGSLGFNLLEVVTRFADTLDSDGNLQAGSGFASHEAFVAGGSEAAKPYGVGGVGSGRMPGQCNTDLEDDGGLLRHRGCMLTPEQIAAIVEYERCGLAATDEQYRSGEYDCPAPDQDQ